MGLSKSKKLGLLVQELNGINAAVQPRTEGTLIECSKRLLVMYRKRKTDHWMSYQPDQFFYDIDGIKCEFASGNFLIQLYSEEDRVASFQQRKDKTRTRQGKFEMEKFGLRNKENSFEFYTAPLQKQYKDDKTTSLSQLLGWEVDANDKLANLFAGKYIKFVFQEDLLTEIFRKWRLEADTNHCTACDDNNNKNTDETLAGEQECVTDTDEVQEHTADKGKPVFYRKQSVHPITPMHALRRQATQAIDDSDSSSSQSSNNSDAPYQYPYANYPRKRETYKNGLGLRTINEDEAVVKHKDRFRSAKDTVKDNAFRSRTPAEMRKNYSYDSNQTIRPSDWTRASKTNIHGLPKKRSKNPLS